MPLIVIAGIAVSVALIFRWRLESLAHRRRVDVLAWRIHVNGIRGKSTVARMIAGMLREHELVTVAKSTGTFAAVINRDGVDEPIKRKGPPTILEQIELCRNYVTPDVDALVIECMALKPEYQKVSEQMIVRSNIGVITNVREDHQDVMGETLPEIARSLLSTCPINGILITSEQNPEILEIMDEVARTNGSRLIVADPDRVTDEENSTFDFISFKENVTIALSIADIIGIPRDVAVRGMAKAEPDPGVLRMKELHIGDGPVRAEPGAAKKVTWANLFAVNDRESMIAAMQKLDPFMTDDTTVVGILNNRSDRERRAIQFADVGANDLEFDRLVTFGAYEGLVTDRLKTNGYNPDHILNLGDEHSFTQTEIIDQMVLQQPSTHVLVVGFVNIHTHQAEEMLEYFEHEATPWDLADSVVEQGSTSTSPDAPAPESASAVSVGLDDIADPTKDLSRPLLGASDDDATRELDRPDPDATREVSRPDPDGRALLRPTDDDSTRELVRGDA